MAGVRAGGDRQELHESIRRHSQDAALVVKLQGKPNDLIDRLRQDPAFANIDLGQVLDAQKYIGRAPEQVDAFIEKVVTPIRHRHKAVLGQRVELKV